MATQDGAHIQINITTMSRGQVMFRLNTKTDTYEVRRCAYQDFNSWGANETFFNNSLNLADQSVFTNDFNSWPTNVTYYTPINDGFEDFQSWPLTNGTTYVFRPVSSLETGASNGYWMEDFYIDTGIGMNNTADRYIRFYGGPNGALWPRAATLTEGLEKVSWRARCRFEDNFETIYTNASAYNWTNYCMSATLQATNCAGWPTMSLLAYYQNSSNYYECQVRGTNYNTSSQPCFDFHVFSVKNGQRKHRWNTKVQNKSISNAMTVTFGLSTENRRVRIRLRTSQGGNREWSDGDAERLTGGGTIGLRTDDAAIIADNIAVSNWCWNTFDGIDNWPWMASTNIYG